MWTASRQNGTPQSAVLLNLTPVINLALVTM